MGHGGRGGQPRDVLASDESSFCTGGDCFVDGGAWALAGARVVVADLDEEGGRGLAERIGDRAVFQRLDVTDEDSWSATVAATLARWGRVDVLVNNAGLLRIKAITDLDLETYREIIAVNEAGPFLGIRAVLGTMAEAGGGSIVNISSAPGTRGGARGTAYNSTKSAVLGIARSVELAPVGIRVNAVLPGAIETPPLAALSDSRRAIMTAQTPMGRFGQPPEVAEMVCFLASDAGSYCTGGEFFVDGGMRA